MEIKQIAESITRVTHAKKILKPDPFLNKSVTQKKGNDTEELSEEDHDTFGPENDGIGLKNRPKLLRNFLKQQEKRNAIKHRSSK